MTGNFTLKSLIAVLQSELNWYSKYFPALESDVKALVKKAIEGGLTDSDFDTFYSNLNYRAGVTIDNNTHRRPRRNLLIALRMDNYRLAEDRDVHELMSYQHPVADSDEMKQRVLEEIMSLCDKTMLLRFYREFNTPKGVPWSNAQPRFETLRWLADDTARKYPFGLQILVEEPRLTDAFSSEVYREFDEIIGAMEKLNADPKFADAGEKGYVIGYRNDAFNEHGSTLNTELRKLVDGDNKTGGFDEDDEIDFYRTRDNSPEGYLVTELTSKQMMSSVLKAVISATMTRDQHGRVGNRGGGIIAVRPGYFADLDEGVVKSIYNEGLAADVIGKVADDLEYYIFQEQRVDFDDNDYTRLNFTSRKINSVARAYFNGPKPGDSLRFANATEKRPISAYMDQQVDFDFASKNDGLLKVSAVNGYYSYYRLLANIVFKDFGPLLFDHSGSGDHKLQIRRQLTRIKGVPLRKVWELPLIVNPFRTPEEIFADLGYELHEVSEPNAKPEAPVRKPGGKRK